MRALCSSVGICYTSKSHFEYRTRWALCSCLWVLLLHCSWHHPTLKFRDASAGYNIKHDLKRMLLLLSVYTAW